MTDRLGNKLNIGDWILYIPKSVPFLDGYSICQIKTIAPDDDALGSFAAFCTAIDYHHFEYQMYGNTVEKLPDDLGKQEEYVFLKTLEFA
jgi:hypothetical protein